MYTFDQTWLYSACMYVLCSHKSLHSIILGNSVLPMLHTYTKCRFCQRNYCYQQLCYKDWTNHTRSRLCVTFTRSTAIYFVSSASTSSKTSKRVQCTRTRNHPTHIPFLAVVSSLGSPLLSTNCIITEPCCSFGVSDDFTRVFSLLPDLPPSYWSFEVEL